VADFTFTRATKSQQKARIALAGPSGSGKTWTALSIATGLGQSIAVIDTERGSASKYATDFAFDTCPMYTYDPRDLPKVLSAAAAAGYEVVIVDSLSHFWMGQGGMLEQVDNATKRSSSGNSFGGWKEMRPAERAMIDALLAYPGHLLVTMRTKTEWVITENERGRKEPKKIGTKPEQRDGIEYEFDLVGDMDHEHTLIVSKSRISTLADEVITRPGPELGTRIRDWLMDGVKLPTVSDYLADLAAASDFDAVGVIFGAVKARNLTGAPCTDAQGEATTLGALIIAKGNGLKPADNAAAGPAQPERKAQRSTPKAPVEDEFSTPAPPQEQAAPPVEPPTANAGLVKAVNTSLSNHGIRDADCLAKLSEITKRTVESSNHLTVAEARLVLVELAKPQQPTGPLDGGTSEQDRASGEQLFQDLKAAIVGAPDTGTLEKIYEQAVAANRSSRLTPQQFAQLDEIGAGIAADFLAAQQQPAGAAA
jgi:hypothetical protein